MTTLFHTANLRLGQTDVESLETLRDEINRQNPDLVILSGDFTQNGTRKEFRAAREFLKRLTPPLLTIAGDRDVPRFHLWERLTDPMRRYRDHIAPLPDTVHEEGEAFLVGVSAKDKITPAQIDFTHHQFRQAPQEKVRIFVSHHPFTDPALADILRRQCVDVVLTGGAFQTLKPLDGPVVLGAPDPESCNILHILPDRIDIQTLHLADRQGPATMAETLTIPRRRDDPEE